MALYQIELSKRELSLMHVAFIDMEQLATYFKEIDIAVEYNCLSLKFKQIKEIKEGCK